MGSVNFRDAYEFDPETYRGQGAGDLPGMLQAVMPKGQAQPTDSSARPNAMSAYDSGTYASPQGGLLGRLLALHVNQSTYQPVGENNGSPSLAPPEPEFGQITRASDAAQPQTPTRAETTSLDPVDIAKSLGIGVVNGGINAVGLIGDALTGFGHFPNNFVANTFRRIHGFPQIPADEPDHFKSWTSDELRRGLEDLVGELYQSRSRAGRYAETIGEMVPMVVGGELPGVVRGTQLAGAALRELPSILAKHAVAPGIAVQALEEALPDSQIGQTLQKAYPVVRRGVPIALAAQRYLGKRVAP
jgi:hypothetical protein